MKRNRLAVVAAAAAIALLSTAPAAAAGTSGTTGLNNYVKNADGSYGYDATKPVYLYPGSTQQVQIPTTYTAPKAQMRSSWVATIGGLNISLPTNEADFQQQYTNILSQFKKDNMNAMIFQVRPMQDAFYKSALNPWSQYLSGQQGKDPGYDPLTWMIDQTHKAGMQYHAWFNPYRVTNTQLWATSMLTSMGITATEAHALTAQEAVQRLAAAGVLANSNYAVQHPDQVQLFNGTLFLDPGVPAAQDHVVASIAEVADKYDIDAVHLDDYFYPYNTTVNGQTVSFGQAGEDRATFVKYGLTAGYPDTAAGISQWRRDNITSLITKIKKMLDVHNAKAHTAVQFGVSPFGIWDSIANDPRGSQTPTSTTQTYDGSVYADTYSWVKNNLIDYITPQIYWAFNQAVAPYGELASWWANVVKGTHVQLYIGHANYKYLANGASDPAWMNPDEVPNQLRFNQTLPGISGDVFYGYNDIVPSDVSALPAAQQPAAQVKNESIATLQQGYWQYPTLNPAMPQLADRQLHAPVSVGYDTRTTTLSWSDPHPNDSRFYVVYAGTGSAKQIVASPKNIVAKVWAGGARNLSYNLSAYLGATGNHGQTLVVTALDRASNESSPAVATSPRSH